MIKACQPRGLGGFDLKLVLLRGRSAIYKQQTVIPIAIMTSQSSWGLELVVVR
jgi:hypothetical protein